MKFYRGFFKKSFVTGALVICIMLGYLFTGIEVRAQFQPPCIDSTPFCPCVIEGGECFDIDTPIDNNVLMLLISGLLIGFYKLYSRKIT